MSKGRAARQKGKRGERATATEIRDALPQFASEVRRGWQSREGDDDPDVMGIPGYWLEVKTLARFNTAPLDQAFRDARGRGIPVAVIRVNNKKPVAMLPWDELLRLFQLKFGGSDAGHGSLRQRGGRRHVPRDSEVGWLVRLRPRQAGARLPRAA